MTTTSRGTYWLPKSSEEKLLEKMILETLSSRGLSDWTVIFGRQSDSMGYCAYGTKEICISRRVVLTDWSHAVDTAMHEVAHAIVGSSESHGARWKAVARELGATPEAKADYVNRDQLGSAKTVKTNYGPVKISIGDSTVVYGDVGTLKIVDVSRKYFVGESALGSRFRLPLDLLHPNYGDSSKIPQSAIVVKDRRGKPVEITLGLTSYVHRGSEYIALEPAKYGVLAIDSRGRRLRVDASLLRD